jgi:hypothetical protein
MPASRAACLALLAIIGVVMLGCGSLARVASGVAETGPSELETTVVKRTAANKPALSIERAAVATVRLGDRHWTTFRHPDRKIMLASIMRWCIITACGSSIGRRRSRASAR